MNLEELAETKKNFTLNNIKYKDYIRMRFMFYLYKYRDQKTKQESV